MSLQNLIVLMAQKWAMMEFDNAAAAAYGHDLEDADNAASHIL